MSLTYLSGKLATSLLTVALILLLASSAVFSQSPQGTCCDADRVKITTSQTENCCLEVYVSWECLDPGNLEVVFEKMNSDGTWKEEGSVGKIPASFVICPNVGAKSITFRIKLRNKMRKAPWCGSAEYAEGYSMYTRTANLCCDCPTNLDQWLDVRTVKDQSCPDGGCRVEYALTIPDNYGCFVRYKVGDSSPVPIGSKVISGTLGCIGKGSSRTISMTLYMNAYGDGNAKPCIIEKTVKCDEIVPDTATTPCTPDCVSDPFIESSVDEFTSPNCPGCIVKAAYTWRKACEKFQEVQITRLEINPPGCEKTCGVAQLYKDALLGIISRNRMGFSPSGRSSDTCSTIWRVVMGGCWSWYTQYTISFTAGEKDSVLVWKPCKQSSCCVQPMTVCKLKNPDRIRLTYTDGYAPSIDCSNTFLVDPRTLETHPCYPKCNWLTNLEGEYDISYAPLIRPRYRREQEKVIADAMTVSIGADVTQESLALVIENDRVRNARIVISNATGTVLVDRTISTVVGTNYSSFNLSPYPNGRYIYSVYVDGIMVRSDAFSVVH